MGITVLFKAAPRLGRNEVRMSQTVNSHSGHRQRMIAKLKHSVLSDQEVLEVMMYNAVPRKNTSDLAHRLLSTFETVEGVLEAPVGLLTLVDGVGDSLAAYLRCVGIFCEYYYRKKRKPYPVEYDQKEFLNFVAGEYAEMKVEVLDFYFLDKAREIIGRRRFSAMDPDRVPVAPDQLTELILKSGAAGIVMVHNHPNQPSSPSKSDTTLTGQCQWLCGFHNILFCDHVICGNDGIFSYYQSGMLREFSERLSVEKAVTEVVYGKE